MLKYIIKTFTYLLTFILLIITIDLALSLVDKEKLDFKLADDTKYVVFGHSHPENAFNDSIIDNFVNMGQSGEAYLYTFLKARRILKQTPSIETVFIEFTNNQVDSVMDSWTWDDNHVNYRYPKYSSLMSVYDKIILFKHNPGAVINSSPLDLKLKVVRLIKGNYSLNKMIGGYVYENQSRVDSIVNDIDKLKRTKLSNVISSENIKNLDLLVKLCQKKGKKVILIRCPQYKKYRGFSNEEIYKSILKNKFKNVDYIDFTSFPLKKSEFLNLDHLNCRGADKFSVWFDSLLKKGLVNKKDKQLFVDKEMNVLINN